MSPFWRGFVLGAWAFATYIEAIRFVARRWRRPTPRKEPAR